ncbi:serine hydrolase domain-containing protein [Portibacter lacus]|uniref:Beta-lactamase-related domain-containing protein n=1 Tax=Portibacter lacus TaxID=1099794 RepID=A0AA37SVI3_9BACT|nr:serine hydrolase domain-containing protein [Portibacter lacus]GLR19521.1 hypothetical protein GCM10007940_41370 [Portibacter lacus]
MYSLKYLLPILLFFISCGPQSRYTDPQDADASIIEQTKTSEVDKLIRTYADYGEFNGALLVANEGKVIYQEGFGYANMEWNIPNQSDTKFRIGSITKQFTAILVLKLVAENKLDLHTPISNYLSEYPKENAEQISIHHLLTHSSGIPNNFESTKRKAFRPDNYSSRELVDEFSSLPLEFEPGSKFSYCNAGYNLLGHIVEEITGMRYEEALQKVIFDPLEMKNTGFDKHRAQIKNRASGYFESFKTYYNSNYIDMSTVYAAGAMYSTVEDLFRWDQALYSDKILPKNYLDSIFMKHIEDPGYGGYYGYGWSIKDKPLGNSDEVVETIVHDGVIDGFCAIITRIPSRNSAIILLSNIRRAPLNAMTKGIMGILYNKPYDVPRRSVAFAFLDAVNEKGLEKAIIEYKRIKGDPDYYLSEEEMNIASYKLLQADQPEHAETLLRLGIEAFPEAFNLYDSLGEVLMSLGKKQESILNYKKSIQSNPENENGIRMLEKLEAGMEE